MSYVTASAVCGDVTFCSLAGCYVTLITARAEFEDESLPLPPLSVLMHCPVNWFTLRGLLISCGFVPTGLRCKGGPAGGGWCGGWWWCTGGNPPPPPPPPPVFEEAVDGWWGGKILPPSPFIGVLHSNADVSCGVSGLCKLMHGLARLTDGLARLVLGLGSIIEGLVRLDNPLSPPGLDNEWLILSLSSSGGVFASPTLPQLPRLSSDWFPSILSLDSMYRMHFFLRLHSNYIINVNQTVRLLTCMLIQAWRFQLLVINI